MRGYFLLSGYMMNEEHLFKVSDISKHVLLEIFLQVQRRTNEMTFNEFVEGRLG